jgi:hypothetical protein
LQTLFTFLLNKNNEEVNRIETSPSVLFLVITSKHQLKVYLALNLQLLLLLQLQLLLLQLLLLPDLDLMLDQLGPML